MTRKRLGAVGAAVIVAAGGTGTAIAVTKQDDAKQAEDAVIAGAAERLDVSPEKLRDALSAAQDDQIDAQVKAGKLTQAQADALRQRRERSGRVLGGPGLRVGPGHGVRGRGLHRRGEIRGMAFEELAKALGVTEKALGEAFRDGKDVGDVAKAQGKDIAGVKAALKAAAKRRVDEAVAAKRLPAARGARIAKRLEAMIDEIEDFPRIGPGPGRGGRGHGFGPGPGGPPPMPPLPPPPAGP